MEFFFGFRLGIFKDGKGGFNIFIKSNVTNTSDKIN
jgi:hypothetical protein